MATACSSPLNDLLLERHVRRLTVLGISGGLAIQLLAALSVWGQWSHVLVLGLGFAVMSVLHWVVSDKLTPRLGMERAENLRIAPNVIGIAIVGLATGWSVPSLLYFPFLAVMLGGIQTTGWTRRFVVTLVPLASLALLDGAAPVAVGGFVGVAVFLHLVSQAHSRFARELIAEREQHLAELSAAHRELVSAQQKAIASERLASIGLLSAGVAHEINNPMSFITANVTGLLADLEDEPGLSPALAEYRDEILPGTLDGIRRVNQIVADLRRFARREAVEEAPFDLGEEVAAAVRIARFRLTGKQRLKTRFDSTPKLIGLPRQIGQVALNLIVNAIEASGADGQIVVATRTVNGQAVFYVGDNGSGMSAETQAQLFSPFFTTKEVGKGTGLGLAVSWGIVQAHRGRIAVSSAVGKGTTFEVWLPASQSASAPAAEPAPASWSGAAFAGAGAAA